MDSLEEFWKTFGDTIDTSSYYYNHEGRLAKVKDNLNNLLREANYRADTYIGVIVNTNADSSDTELVKLLVQHIHWLRGVDANVKSLTTWLSTLRETKECKDASLEEMLIRRKNIMATIATYISEIESRQEYMQNRILGKKIVIH